MVTLTPVEHDPFSDTGASSLPADVKLTPVDHDPFANQQDNSPQEKPGFWQGFGQQLKDTYVDSPINFIEGIGRGALKRGVGIDQAIYDALPEGMVSDKTKQDATAMATQLKAQDKGTGAAGTLGEIAGDPLSYVPIGEAGKGIAGLVELSGKLGGLGVVGGATAPVAEGESRAQHIAVSGVIGALSPTVVHTLAQIPYLPETLMKLKQYMVGSATKNQATENAYKNVAEKLVKEGVTPEKLQDAGTQAQSTGLGATLPEFANSSSLLADQKNIAKGTGAGANILRETLANRATETIPNRVSEFANTITPKKEVAGEAYKAILPNTELPPEVFAQISQDPIINDALQKVRKDKVYNKGFQDVADQKSITLDALPDNNYAVLQRTKEVLDDKINRAATKRNGTKAELMRQSQQILVDAMDTHSPEFAANRRLYQEGSTGNKILKAVRKNKIGSIAPLRNTLFGSQEKIAAYKKSLSPEDFTGLVQLMKGIEQVERGNLADSGTAYNALSQKELANNTGARGAEMVGAPLNAMKRLGEWYSDKVRQKDYEAIAKLFTNPDLAKLGEAMKGLKKTSPEAKNILGNYAAKLMAIQAGKLQGQQP